MGRIIPYIMENKKCLKPPTRYIYIYDYNHIFLISTTPVHHEAKRSQDTEDQRDTAVLQALPGDTAFPGRA